jgi:hypothetical protein
VILFFLVVSSILLTGLLLFGQPPLETAAPPAYERLVFGELRPVSEHIQPQLVRTSEEGRQILLPWHKGYGAAWETLQSLFAVNHVPESSQLPEEFTVPDVAVIFPVPALPELWVPYSTPAQLGISSMAWYAQDPQTVWYQSAEGHWYRAPLANLPDNWQDTLDEAFLVGEAYKPTDAEEWGGVAMAGTVYIPVKLPQLARYSVKPEDLDTEKLLRSIFVDPALVRQIQERDGAFIYTDGQRGLRIFEHGEVEYTSPNSEPGLEPMSSIQALRRTAQFLQLMGGWPDNLYLQDFTSVDRQHWNSRLWDTYSLSFYSTQQGMPVLTTNSPVVLRFSDRGVIDYRRQIAVLDSPYSDPVTLLDPRDAILIAREDIADRWGDGALVEVYPAFSLAEPVTRQTVAQPAWVFRLDNGMQAVIHGHTGSFLYWLE